MHELTKQSWACDNTAATSWPCFQAKKLLLIVLWLYSQWLLHLDTEDYTFLYFFMSLKLCYVVASSMSRSFKIVACPALLARVSIYPTFILCSVSLYYWQEEGRDTKHMQPATRMPYSPHLIFLSWLVPVIRSPMYLSLLLVIPALSNGRNPHGTASSYRCCNQKVYCSRFKNTVLPKINRMYINIS